VVLTRVLVHQMAREICHLRQNVYRVLYVNLVKGLSRVRSYLQTNVIKFNLSCCLFFIWWEDERKNRTLIDQIIGDVQYIDIIGFFRLQSLYYRSAFYSCTLWIGTHGAISWSEINICLLHVYCTVYQFRECRNKKQILYLKNSEYKEAWVQEKQTSNVNVLFDRSIYIRWSITTHCRVKTKAINHIPLS